HTIADCISDDEGVRPTVQEGDIERRAAFSVNKPASAEGTVLAYGKNDETIGIRGIGGDGVVRAALPLDPENRRAIRIQARGNDWFVEGGTDKEKFFIGRQHDH